MTPLALIALTLAAPQDTIELKVIPREGVTLRRTVELWNVHEVEHTSDGSEIAIAGEGELKLVVLDRVTKVHEGALLAFTREYEALSRASESESDYGDGTHASEWEMESDLEGEVVAFSRRSADEDFTAASEDLEDALLADLAWNLDFDLLLPGRPVEVGDEWAVDLSRMREVNDPSAGIPWRVTGQGDTIAMGSDDDSETAEETEGEVTVTLDEVTEEDGDVLALLTIGGEFELAVTVEAYHEDEDSSSDTHQEVDSEIQVEGTAIWNVTQGRLQHLTLESEAIATGAGESTITHGGETYDDAFEFDSDTANHLEVNVEAVREG